MSTAAPVRDGVGLATLALFGLSMGFIGLRGLHQGHFDHLVTWQGQPLGFALRFLAWMAGSGLCLWGTWALWRMTLAPDARLWQDTAPLPREEPPQRTLHERASSAGARLAGLLVLLVCGAGVTVMHVGLEPLLGRARWILTGPLMLFLLVGLLFWLFRRPGVGPRLVIGPEGLQDLQRPSPPIAWEDVSDLQLQGARLLVALHPERRDAVLKRLGRSARWSARSLRWDGDGADVAISLRGLDARPTEVLALARDWHGWVLAQSPAAPAATRQRPVMR